MDKKTNPIYVKRRYTSAKIGNSRALEYFRKCGAVSTGNKTIDYKSAIVQKYKELLTAEVDGDSNAVSKHILAE